MNQDESIINNQGETDRSLEEKLREINFKNNDPNTSTIGPMYRQ